MGVYEDIQSTVLPPPPVQIWDPLPIGNGLVGMTILMQTSLRKIVTRWRGLADPTQTSATVGGQHTLAWGHQLISAENRHEAG